MTTKEFTAHVYVSLSDWDNDDLIKESQRRGRPEGGFPSDAVEAIRHFLKQGRDAEALATMKSAIEEHFGVVL